MYPYFEHKSGALCSSDGLHELQPEGFYLKAMEVIASLSIAFMFPSCNVEPNGSFVCVEQLVLCMGGQAEEWKHTHEDTNGPVI